MKKIFCIMFIVTNNGFAQVTANIKANQTETPIRMIFDHENNLYHEPLLYFLNNQETTSIYYRYEPLIGENDIISLFLSIFSDDLYVQIKDQYNFKSLHPILPTNFIAYLFDPASGETYHLRTVKQNEYLLADYVLELNFSVPKHQISKILNLIHNKTLQVYFYYIYPAKLDKKNEYHYKYVISILDSKIDEIFGENDYLYFTKAQLSFLLSDSFLQIIGFSVIHDKSRLRFQSHIPIESHFIKHPIRDISRNKISLLSTKSFKNISEDEKLFQNLIMKSLSLNSDLPDGYLYKVYKSYKYTFRYYYFDLINTEHFISKQVAVRDMKHHKVSLKNISDKHFYHFEGDIDRLNFVNIPITDNFFALDGFRIRYFNRNVYIKTNKEILKLPIKSIQNIQYNGNNKSFRITDSNHYEHLLKFNSDNSIYEQLFFFKDILISKAVRYNIYIYSNLSQKKPLKSYSSNHECGFPLVTKHNSKTLQVKSCGDMYEKIYF